MRLSRRQKVIGLEKAGKIVGPSIKADPWAICWVVCISKNDEDIHFSEPIGLILKIYILRVVSYTAVNSSGDTGAASQVPIWCW